MLETILLGLWILVCYLVSAGLILPYFVNKKLESKKTINKYVGLARDAIQKEIPPLKKEIKDEIHQAIPKIKKDIKDEIKKEIPAIKQGIIDDIPKLVPEISAKLLDDPVFFVSLNGFADKLVFGENGVMERFKKSVYGKMGVDAKEMIKVEKGIQDYIGNKVGGGAMNEVIMEIGKSMETDPDDDLLVRIGKILAMNYLPQLAGKGVGGGKGIFNLGKLVPGTGQDQYYIP